MTHEERIARLERTFLALNEILLATEEQLDALDKCLRAVDKAHDGEINIVLRTVVRLRGLRPEGGTNKHLIKVLLEDEYGVKLNFKDGGNAAGGPTPQREG
jgi:hypothetical protein